MTNAEHQREYRRRRKEALDKRTAALRIVLEELSGSQTEKGKRLCALVRDALA